MERTDFPETLQQLNVLDDHLRPTEYSYDAIEKSLQEESAIFTNIFVKSLSILGGIFASLLFIGFLALAGIYNAETGAMILGFLLVGVALFLKAQIKTVLLDTISVCAVAIGLAMITLGLYKIFKHNDTAVMTAIAIIAAIIIMVNSSSLINLLCFVLFNLMLQFIVFDNHWLIAQYFYLVYLLLVLLFTFYFEAKMASKYFWNSRLQALCLGGIFSYLFFLFLIGDRRAHFFPRAESFVFFVLILSVLFFLTYKIARNYGLEMKKALVICTILCVVLAPTFYFPAVAGTFLLILLSFYTKYMKGFILASAAFVFSIGQYYYDLQITLLVKSIVLMSTGILFIGAYFLIRRMVFHVR